MRRPSRRILLGVALVMAILATACDSQDMPLLRNVPWVNIALGRIYGSTTGAVAVDGFMWAYQPCHDNRAPNPPGFEQDRFFGACLMPSIGNQPVFHSYTEFIGWTGNNANNPHGIFLGNANTCRDTSGHWCKPGQVLNHGWAQRWTKFALELYPDDPNATGVRLEVACCPHLANGGAYTTLIGDVTLPRSGTPGTSGLNGSVTGVSAPDQVGIDVFQVDEVPNARSSLGVPLYSFASTHNGATGGVGTWSVPAVYRGNYAIYLTDKAAPQRKVVVRRNVTGNTTINIDRNAPCFGLSPVYHHATWHLNELMTPAQCTAMWS